MVKNFEKFDIIFSSPLCFKQCIFEQQTLELHQSTSSQQGTIGLGGQIEFDVHCIGPDYRLVILLKTGLHWRWFSAARAATGGG